MRTTIDKAGRVVIPVALRQQAGLLPGTELEIVAEGFSLRLERSVSGPELERRGNRWVVSPTVPQDQRPQVDLATLISKERDRWP